jgi:hypothetical protein
MLDLSDHIKIGKEVMIEAGMNGFEQNGRDRLVTDS